jgi:hypothetical protein
MFVAACIRAAFRSSSEIFSAKASAISCAHGSPARAIARARVAASVPARDCPRVRAPVRITSSCSSSNPRLHRRAASGPPSPSQSGARCPKARRSSASARVGEISVFVARASVRPISLSTVVPKTSGSALPQYASKSGGSLASTASIQLGCKRSMPLGRPRAACMRQLANVRSRASGARPPNARQACEHRSRSSLSRAPKADSPTSNDTKASKTPWVSPGSSPRSRSATMCSVAQYQQKRIARLRAMSRGPYEQF